MGREVIVEGLTKSFGTQTVWQDVTLTLPPGEISVMLGPSGTGKTVFLKSIIGLLRPERGRVMVGGVDMVNSPERDIYEARKMFGLMFQDGALFGSMNLFDNIAFPLREHTRKKESQIRRIVMERMEMVGLLGAEGKLPGEISGGMRKRAGLARALVLDPQIILCDEPDSGLDPVRTSYISQLLIDLNAQIDATMLIVTHNLDIASTVPDNMGMLFRRRLVAFGPREVLLTSEEPVVRQFLSGRRTGPIGMAEEKDEATLVLERLGEAQSPPPVRPVAPQLEPSPGLPPRAAVPRRRERVLAMWDRLPQTAREALRTVPAATSAATPAAAAAPVPAPVPEETA
ncbi:ABC transporter ATP-binding protein [Streptomyces sp. HPF1205]|uniref:ABC transporter ATP-binding protein n=1 Tax=Streptomyces sp. HPF1205 TaxID=2873262 RepID=UPI001CEC026B|nr:ATP-binding cassette domain-containing protein [Streptomyces sp. HPF1205]